jgi:hypothetical protein
MRTRRAVVLSLIATLASRTAATDAQSPYAQSAGRSKPSDHLLLHSVPEEATLPSGDIRLADDYCNSRCDQQFNYCRYRGESLDRCFEQLITCRKDC